MAEANNTIKIDFKAVNAPRLEKAIKSLDKATQSLIKSQASLNKEGRKFKNQNEKINKGILDLNGSQRLLGGAFATVRSQILLFNFAMGLGIRQVARLVAEASKVEGLRTAFEALSGESGTLTESLGKIREATDGTMSDFALFEQANNAMILGVTKNSDEMAEMFDIAQRLGRALGKDTAQSVESLVTGIGRQSRLMLDNIGIVVKSEEAYEKYANKLNKTAKDLTDAEKKQAFLEATMESARQKVAELGDEILTTRDEVNRFTASSENLSVAVGEALAPAFTKLTKESTTVLNNLTDLAKIFGKTESVNVTYYKTLETTTNFIEEYSKKHNIAIDSTKSLDYQLQQLLETFSLEAKIEKDKGVLGGTEMRNALARTEEAFKNYTTASKNFFDSAKKDSRPMIDYAFNITSYDEALKELGESLRAMADEDLFEGMVFSDIDEMIKEHDEEIKAMMDSEKKKTDFTIKNINKLSSALSQATLNGQNLGEAVVNSIKAIAVEMASKAFIFTAFQALGIGGAGFAKKTLSQFLGFAHTGGLIKNNGRVQRFATGGMVQGQDNVPIMAQAGEFVIRKAVVEQVGVDNLARLNSGEGGVGTTINVNISGGVVDESYINNELIPALNKATSLGNTINA
jgi:hypothetical protein